MGKIKDSLYTFQYMALYGTDEQKERVREIIARYEESGDSKALTRDIVELTDEDCMVRN